MIEFGMPKLELQMPNPDKQEITNFKHHLILKLGQINSNIQNSNKIKNQLFGILNFGH
jgi:hypothetical protein